MLVARTLRSVPRYKIDPFRSWPRAVAIAASATLLLFSFPAHASDLDSAALYRSNCAPCHGVTGQGGGPVASSISVLMPQLATLSERHGGVFPEDYVTRVIDGREVRPAHGSADMPVWGQIFDQRHAGEGEETSTPFLIEALVEHLKTLQVE